MKESDYMKKQKLLQIRVDEDFLSKLEYLRAINGFKSIAETVRKIIHKEYTKEKERQDKIDELRQYVDANVHPLVSPDNYWCYSQLIDMIDDL